MNIRKRLLSFIICGVMAFSACPLTAFAGDGETGDAIVEETECICETLCDEENINENCPVCYENWENCEGEEPECDCETLCKEEEVNGDCPVCSEDWGDCEGKEPECECEILCTEEEVNEDCTVCSEDWENCEGEEPENGIMLMSDEDIKLVDKVDEVYEIYTAEGLREFAEMVNSGKTDIDGKLMNDIDLNPGITFDEDGNFDSGTPDQWTPIGQNFNERYRGTFDGQNHTISGLYIDSKAEYIGLFGYIGEGGAVKNVGIVDSYISYINGSGSPLLVYVGAICGYNSGTITNCYNTGTVSGISASFINYVGGICGNNTSGIVTNCYNTGTVSSTGTVSGSGRHAGGVCGISYGTVENCYNTGAVSSTTAGGSNYAGGVCGQNMNTGKIENCYNTGAVSSTGAGSRNYAGGVCGYNDEGEISNCYNTGNVSGRYAGGVCGQNTSGIISKISKCYNTGAVSGRYAGGVCGWNLGGTVENCYNTGTVSSTGTASSNYAGGVCGQNMNNGKIENCYNTGTVSGGREVGGVCGWNLGGSVKNCYYLKGSAASDSSGVPLTEYQFGLKDKFSGWDFENVWKMDIPLGRPTLTNNKEESPEDCSDGTEENPYLISNAGQLAAFASAVNDGQYGICAKLTEDIVIQEGVLKADGSLNGGDFDQWTPICDSESNPYSGTFDGDGHSISGLYINGAAGYIGLFGYIGEGGAVKNVGIVDSYISYINESEDESPVGGVCGVNSGTITNCYNTGTVSGSCLYAGGVCGWNYNGTITNCYNTGTVSGIGLYAGGVCGWNNSTITNCYNTGIVSVSGLYAGGVCGNNGGTVKNCYNTGAVSGEYAGGVCGRNMNDGTIENCYNTGAVSSTTTGGSNYAGGVCGNNYGTVENCYYLKGLENTDDTSEEKTAAEFLSGEVAWLLQNGQGDQVWGQKIGVDSYPKFSDEKVLKVTLMDGEDEIGAVYANAGGTIAEPDIDVGKGFYVDGWYTDSDLDGDEWDFENDTIDDDITLYADVEERRSSGGGSYSLSEGIDRDEPEEQPEYRPDEPSTPETPGFIDVDIFDWYHDGVMYATENGIMNGVGGNRFEPETELKREMLAVILWNMTDNPEPNGIAPFLDVTSDKYYAKAIAWANKNGVMYGYGEEFGVGEAVTREDFAAILYRYAAFKGYDTTQGGMAIREFIDFDQIADYAAEALGWAVNSGIISGMGDGTVSPKTSTYRGQAAVMLMKFCENIMK